MRKLGLGVLLVVSLALSIGVVSAQDEPTAPLPRHLPQELMDIATEATGLEASAIRERIHSGTSLAELIEANGGDVDAVAAEAVSVITERINQRLADDTISQERADMMLERVDEAVERGLNFVPREGGRFPFMRLRGVHHMLAVASELTGLDESEVVAQLRSGSTLTDVLTENGTNMNDFIDQIIEDADDRLDEAVSSGRIDEARAAEILNNLRAELEEHFIQGAAVEI